MPTYQYRCTQCATELEAVQKFTDPPLAVCPECEGSLRKVFSAVGVVFKGSGFYATDSRSKGKSNAAKPAASSTSSASDSSSGTKDAAGSKPAEKPASTAAASAA
ncbi:MAG: FmdB family transcriptional regulator [Actinobacteria bacterium]|nr:FmdB family transcriptional regulator [Actinomycetota bacterium]